MIPSPLAQFEKRNFVALWRFVGNVEASSCNNSKLVTANHKNSQMKWCCWLLTFKVAQIFRVLGLLSQFLNDHQQFVASRAHGLYRGQECQQQKRENPPHCSCGMDFVLLRGLQGVAGAGALGNVCNCQDLQSRIIVSPPKLQSPFDTNTHDDDPVPSSRVAHQSTTPRITSRRLVCSQLGPSIPLESANAS